LTLPYSFTIRKALLVFSQCTQRAPYNHESSSVERRNFFEKFLFSAEELFIFRMFSSCALHTVKSSGEGILRIRGHLSSASCGGPYSENGLPLGLSLTHNLSLFLSFSFSYIIQTENGYAFSSMELIIHT
jgi:hypothetical protein